ncbi:MAG: glycosyltransferase [Candidatus Tumulicola sp.]
MSSSLLKTARRPNSSRTEGFRPRPPPAFWECAGRRRKTTRRHVDAWIIFSSGITGPSGVVRSCLRGSRAGPCHLRLLLRSSGPLASMIVLDRADRPRISIIILTQDQLEHLGRCLSSIERSIDGGQIPYEVILVFNGTDPSAVQTFLKSVVGLHSVRLALNLGFGGGNNFAVRRARGEYLVFLNDDAVVEPGWLEALLQTALTYPSAGAVGSRILFVDGSLQEAGGIIWSDGSTRPLGRGAPEGSLAYSYLRPVDYISANGLLVRRDAFDALGGFDARYFPAYYEDTDLCLGLRHRLDLEVVYEPRAVIRHVEAATTQDNAFRSFLFRRNQALLREKWGDELALYARPEPESPAAVRRADLRRRGNPTRVLVIDDRLPDAGKGLGGLGSGFVRAHELFAELNSSGFAVAIYPSDRTDPPKENSLASLGVDVIEENLNEHLSRPEVDYDVIVISRPHNAEIFLGPVRAALPDAKIVYDAEALYHKRLRIQAQMEENAEKREWRETEAAAMERLESGIAAGVDAVVAISHEERAWLCAVPNHARIEFMIPLLSGIEIGPPDPMERADAVFVAGWLGGDESPNVDAIRWYCRHVVPEIRAVLPGFRTYVTGKNPPLCVAQLADENVIFTGFVESIRDLYASARVAIAPIRIGAGVKNKTMEALQYGVPVVATQVGAEGLGLSDRVEIDVTDEPPEFASRIIALATDAAAWSSRRDAVEARVETWERARLRWPDVIARAVASGRRPGALVEAAKSPSALSP